MLYLFFCIIFVIITFFVISDSSTKKKKQEYKYYFKKSVMTDREKIFYHKLLFAVGDKYLVFPQIHLSSIFSQYVKGQSFSAAFKKVNSISVDYVIVDKVTLDTLLAIELDDKTHNSKKAYDKDTEKDNLFKSINLPLIRFDSIKISNEEINKIILSNLMK